MVLKTDQERLRTLLKDTITLLCKNGLSFKSKFSVDALIGVTLDEDDVFLVSIQEIIKNEMALPELAEHNQSDAADDNLQQNGKRRRKRRRSRTKIKKEDGAVSDGESSGETTGDSDQETGAQLDHESNSYSVSSAEPSAKRQHLQLKQERDDDGDAEDDIVFVKSELEDNWSQHLGGGDDNDDSNNQASMFPGGGEGDQNFTSLSGLDLVPLSQGEGTWPMGSQLNQRGYRPRISRTSTVTGSPGALSQQQQQQQQQQGNMGDMQNLDQSHSQISGNPWLSDPNNTCNICGKQFRNRYNLKKHHRTHNGEFDYYCQYCGKGCMTRQHLTGHIKKHEGVTNNFTCKLCKKSFAFETGLKSHLRKFHNE